MSAVDTAIQTQLNNIQTKTGKTLDELRTVLQQSGLARHSDIRAMFQRDLALGMAMPICSRRSCATPMLSAHPLLRQPHLTMWQTPSMLARRQTYAPSTTG